MAVYSHSKLSTFENCKYKYKLHYVDGIKPEFKATIETFMGSRVHETLEKLYKDLKFMKENSLEDLIKYLNNQWEKEWADNIIINKKEYGKDNYKKMAEKFITDYYQHHKPFNDIKIIDLETEDKLKLSNGSSYHIRIDKFGYKDDVYYVCDYKTNSSLKTQEEADQDRQLAMYALWVNKKFKDAKKVVLKWHMLAFDKDVISERTPKELEKLEQETISLIKEIESCKEFPTHVTALCNYCEYQTMCPAFKHKVESEQKTLKEFKEDDGVKLVDKLATLKEQTKEAENEIEETQKQLIQFAIQKELEVVYGSNKKAKVTEYYKLKYPEDKTKIIKLLKKHKLYNDFININYLKLNSQILEGNMPKDIEKLPKKEKDYRVSLSKK
ncbi:MAG: PD-(D/E)XK nuclease family protein [archaeon]